MGFRMGALLGGVLKDNTTKPRYELWYAMISSIRIDT
jgi:hypothetical protein